MIYVYRQANSTGARDLAVKLGGRRVHRLNALLRNDVVVSWGESVAHLPGVRVLNGAAIRSKYQDALTLKGAGVPTIEVCERLPNDRRYIGQVIQQVQPVVPQKGGALGELFNDAYEMAVEFVEIDAPNFASQVFKKGVSDLYASLGKLKNAAEGILPAGGARNRVVAAPPNERPAAGAVWLPRKNNHVGGKDLLHPPQQADFYVRKEDITEEYRVHSFLGKSIRTGKKAHREGFARPSAWIRSWDGGWRIVYDGVKGRNEQRNLAHQAVAALGLDFGAVDIGKLRDGRLIVLEVNRAPGIEGGTIDRYATAIQKWKDGEQ